MSLGTRQYRYSYTPPEMELEDDLEQDPDNDSALVINVRCPTLSGGSSWCYKLYGLVLAGLGLIISFIWVCFHLYVLSQTTTTELRMLRYIDIFLGLVEFLSMLSLLYGSYSSSRLFIILFLTSSLGVIVLYWTWYAYYNYDTDRLVYEDQTGLCLLLTLVFLVLLGPVCLNYRNIELTTQQAGTRAGTKRTRGQNYRERERARSPPPKYQESLGGPPPPRS